MTPASAAAELAGSMRLELAGLLPAGSFLRVSREELLFVSDAPRRVGGDVSAGRARRAGYRALTREALLYLGPGAAVLSRLEELFPLAPDELSASLLPLRGRPADERALDVLALGFRRLLLPRQGTPEDYDRQVRRLAALQMRSGGGGCYGCALLLAALYETKDRSKQERSSMK